MRKINFGIEEISLEKLKEGKKQMGCLFLDKILSWKKEKLRQTWQKLVSIKYGCNI